MHEDKNCIIVDTKKYEKEEEVIKGFRTQAKLLAKEAVRREKTLVAAFLKEAHLDGDVLHKSSNTKGRLVFHKETSRLDFFPYKNNGELSKRGTSNGFYWSQNVVNNLKRLFVEYEPCKESEEK